MATTSTFFGTSVWSLPPLILHPFNERVPPSALLDNSKAALMLSGLIPSDGTDEETLRERVLKGRYAEMRMLYFLGKDVVRWLEQCVDWADRIPELADRDIQPQSFAGLLTGNPPEAVRRKLADWGVADYAAIFSRAIGLNAVFGEAPGISGVSTDFLRGYHRYADSLFRCYMESVPHCALGDRNFRFELYASGEYSRMLEKQWNAE